MTALPRRALAVLALTVAVVSSGVAAAPLGGPAAAAARVTVTNEFGRAEADLTYSTAVTVTGSGFQSVSGGFGGVYVLFGWVSDPGGGWRPSRGGATGDTYRYVPDAEGVGNAGFQRFVSFPGSDTSGSANGGVVGADGTWRVSMYVPGPVFTALDRAGAAVTVDCRRVTCGIITVGAHGVVSAANETFTPVSFTQVFDSAPADAPAAAAPPSAAGTAPGGTSAGGTSTGGTAEGTDPVAGAPPPAEESAVPAGPGVLVDPATAVAGRVLSFTAAGLLPGEQVLATLDDGLVSVGPLPVTAQGTVAGLLELPESLAGGNHELRVTGTTTGGLPLLTFAVRSDAGALTVPAAATTGDADRRPSTAAQAFVLAATAVLLVVVTAALTARRTRRRTLARLPATAVLP